MIGTAAPAARLAAIAVASWVLLASAHPAGADQVTLEPSKDNTIFSESDSLSNGIGVSLFAGVTGDGQIRRALLAFDVAGAMPVGATITGAQLMLRVTMSNSGPEPMTVHRLAADWGEGMSNSTVMGGGMGAAATQGDATWGFRFFESESWNTDGGDFSAAASATQQVGNSGTPTWGSTAEMVADLQGWLDAPSSNFGWLVRGNEPGFSAKRFASGEASAATRPKLVIDFQPPGGAATATPTATVASTGTTAPSATVSATAPSSPTSTSTAPTTSTATAPPTATRPADTPTAEATSTATANPSATDTASPTESVVESTPTATPIASPTFTPTQPVSACVGDCDGDGDVSISELITGVNIALGTQPLSRCPAFDPSGDGVSIGDLVTAVNNALDECA